MAWENATVPERRLRFVTAALQSGANISALCREAHISRKTGYKWLARYRQEEQTSLADRSRRPHSSPGRTAGEVEQLVLDARQEYGWGGRKIARYLADQGCVNPPAPSTVSSILARHGLVAPEESAKRRAFQRFVRERPNELWQMDFKGPVSTPAGKPP